MTLLSITCANLCEGRFAETTPKGARNTPLEVAAQICSHPAVAEMRSQLPRRTPRCGRPCHSLRLNGQRGFPKRRPPLPFRSGRIHQRRRGFERNLCAGRCILLRDGTSRRIAARTVRLHVCQRRGHEPLHYPAQRIFPAGKVLARHRLLVRSGRLLNLGAYAAIARCGCDFDTAFACASQGKANASTWRGCLKTPAATEGCLHPPIQILEKEKRRLAARPEPDSPFLTRRRPHAPERRPACGREPPELGRNSSCASRSKKCSSQNAWSSPKSRAGAATAAATRRSMPAASSASCPLSSRRK